MTVLLLGGTHEARLLARRLVDEGIPAVTSLAGAVETRPPAGEVRSGGFGGVDGLVAWMRERDVTRVIDATHPFAAQMTAHAVTACGRLDVPLLRLERPGWATRPDAAAWHWVPDPSRAADAAAGLGRRTFLAVGRQSLAEFTGWSDRFVLARVIDLPDQPVPDAWTLVQARGPFTLEDELRLLRDHAIDVLVTKDSGGPTVAKLDAAAALGIPVVCIERPPAPEGLDTVSSVAEVLTWLRTGQRRRNR